MAEEMTFITADETEQARAMLDELLALEEGLKPGEIEFLDGLYEWEGCFTTKQNKWLNSIYDRVM